jgi:hypothetical protein
MRTADSASLEPDRSFTADVLHAATSRLLGYETPLTVIRERSLLHDADRREGVFEL